LLVVDCKFQLFGQNPKQDLLFISVKASAGFCLELVLSGDSFQSAIFQYFETGERVLFGIFAVEQVQGVPVYHPIGNNVDGIGFYRGGKSLFARAAVYGQAGFRVYTENEVVEMNRVHPGNAIETGPAESYGGAIFGFIVTDEVGAVTGCISQQAGQKNRNNNVFEFHS